jgi:hypothetical protein
MPFIRVNNRSNFLLKEVKEYHPESLDYLQYWKMQKKRCIEGFWSVDDKDIQLDINNTLDDNLKSDKWRWMPSNLYFYVNFGTIMHKPEGSPRTAPKKEMRPFLRDVEWEFFYNLVEARGFSGFSNDEEYSCNTELSKEQDELFDYHASCYNSKGELKKYMPARQYARQHFSKPMGTALWENQAKNLFMLGARGFGKSFTVGVGVVLHEILFDGARYYNEESIKNPYKVEVLVGAAIVSKSADILDKTNSALEKLPGSWGEGDNFTRSPFYKNMAGTLKPNNAKNPWRHEYESKVGGQWIKKGTKSNVKHVTFTTENPEAAAGTRPGIIVVEEVGLCPNLLTVHGSNTACQMEGTTKFGTSIYLGTGGNMEKIVEPQTIFNDPEGFDFLAFENEYEDSDKKIGWFVPAIYALNQFKDHNGNTDLQVAYDYIHKVREKKKRSKDTSALDLEMMNYPLVPSEMFLTKKGNIFPIAALIDRLAEVESDPKYANAEYIGRLKINGDTGKVEWVLDPKQTPITQYPIPQDMDKTGCVVIYAHPFEFSDGEIPYGRYLAGCDPYDHDQSGTGSLGSTIVYDKLTNQIVAEYTGRPETAKDYYEEVRKLLLYYNAKLLYENERKGIFDYFDSKNSTYLLKEQPEIIKDVLQDSKVNRGYGMHMNTPLKRYGEELIKTWLLEPHNETKNSNILNLHTIRCKTLLQELIRYNPEGNFDRAMAFMILMYFLQDTRKIEVSEEVHTAPTIENSNFFNRKHFSKSYRPKF